MIIPKALEFILVPCGLHLFGSVVESLFSIDCNHLEKWLLGDIICLYLFAPGGQFFEMSRHNAMKALEIYKRASQQVALTKHVHFGSKHSQNCYKGSFFFHHVIFLGELMFSRLSEARCSVNGHFKPLFFLLHVDRTPRKFCRALRQFSQ